VLTEIFLIALGALVTAVVGGLLVFLGGRVREPSDQRRVVKWLRQNTKDELGASHENTRTIAKETGLPEERVRRACMIDDRVYLFQGPPEQWSVWRQDPQSIYETRGLLIL
jgi:hypothetical protein